MEISDISIVKARTHNLKGIDVRIPRNSLTVVTGLSGAASLPLRSIRSTRKGSAATSSRFPRMRGSSSTGSASPTWRGSTGFPRRFP